MQPHVHGSAYANVWQSALQRVLETLVAVFCATFVSAVLWPRYASEEFWPVLPQGLLRRHMGGFFGDLRRLLGAQTNGEYIFSQTAMLPIEAMQAINHMALPRCPPEERENLFEFVKTAQPLGLQIATLSAAIADLGHKPEFDLLQPPLRHLNTGIDQFLAGLAGCLRRHDHRLEIPDLDLRLSNVEKVWVQLYSHGFAKVQDADAALGLLNLCRGVTRRLQACGESVEGLRLECYLGDVAL